MGEFSTAEIAAEYEITPSATGCLYRGVTGLPLIDMSALARFEVLLGRRHGLPHRRVRRAGTCWNRDRSTFPAHQWNGVRRQGNGCGIPDGTRNVDAAYRLIDFALRPEVQYVPRGSERRVASVACVVGSRLHERAGLLKSVAENDHSHFPQGDPPL